MAETKTARHQRLRELKRFKAPCDDCGAAKGLHEMKNGILINPLNWRCEGYWSGDGG